MLRVESGGVEIAYETFGDPAGPPVLLVHGFASSRDGNWLRAGWGRTLADAGFRGVALDLRGHGESGRPRALTAYALHLLRADLLAVLDDAGVASAHLLGYSLGARLCWDFALAHPERVRSLVLGGAPFAGSFAGFDFAAARAAVEGRAIRPAASGAPDPTARYLAMIAASPGSDPRALIRVAEAVRRRGFRPHETVPEQRMLVVAGGDDEVAAASARFAGQNPHAEFVELPGRNHIDAITSRVFKDAAVRFLLAEEAARPH